MTNPFFTLWTTPFQAVPFHLIKEEHYKEAFLEGMKQHLAEVEAVANNPAAPSFDNTMLPLEKAGGLLDRVSGAFHVLAGAHTNKAIQALDMEISPLLANHSTAINQNEKLFARIKSLYENRDNLGAVEQRLIERYYIGFVRGGAELQGDAKKRMAVISERLSLLMTEFDQHVLAETNAFGLELVTPADRAGISEGLLQVFLNNGKQRGQEGKYIVTLSRSSIEPFLTQSTRRDLREIAFKGWKARCDQANEHNTSALINEIIALRTEKAKLLGYSSTADYAISDRMAKTPAAAEALLAEVWAAAKRTALAELAEITKLHRAAGFSDDVAPWDWLFYAEQVRVAKYAVEEQEVMQYLTLDKMLEAQFYVAHKLFGISFVPLSDAPVYHEDVRVWNVIDSAGQHMALFYGDYYARPSKNGGAWMSQMRGSNPLLQETPIIYNVCNFNKPAEGEACLLTDDDLRTLFHEFGHALHGMLTRAPFSYLAGTAVTRDFVELPSQLYEHWAGTDEVLGRFAVHHKTGEPMPAALRAKLKLAGRFNQGHKNAEFLGSAFVDMAIHQRTATTPIDLTAFENDVLQKMGMPSAITMRHRLAHFHHLFGGGYYAGYYSYLWSAVLDNDAFKAFEEAGDVFDAATAKRLHDHIYSAGNTEDPAVLYEKFRGRGPTIQALLEYRGLDGKAA